VKVLPLRRPTRSSVIWLIAPLTGFWWHSAQAWACYSGPHNKPSAIPSR